MNYFIFNTIAKKIDLFCSRLDNKRVFVFTFYMHSIDWIRKKQNQSLLFVLSKQFIEELFNLCWDKVSIKCHFIYILNSTQNIWNKILWIRWLTWIYRFLHCIGVVLCQVRKKFSTLACFCCYRCRSHFESHAVWKMAFYRFHILHFYVFIFIPTMTIAFFSCICTIRIHFIQIYRKHSKKNCSQ